MSSITCTRINWRNTSSLRAGTIQFKTYIPDPPLDNCVELALHYKDYRPEHRIERVVPTGHVFLIIELDGFPRHTYDNESLEPIQTLTGAWISGMQTRYISISAHDDSEMFVIKFTAAGAYPILHRPLDTMTGRVLPAADILQNSAAALRKKLGSASDNNEKFAVASDWLESRYRMEDLPPPELRKVVERLRQEPAANLSDIIEEYPYTHKQLISQFKKRIGLTPKVFQRVLRFNDVLQRVHEEKKITWADIAYQCGYFDQSHFIREFNLYSGFNPQEFIDRGHDRQQPNFFPVSEKG